MVLNALREANVRAVLQGWDEALQGIDLPDTVYHAGSLPRMPGCLSRSAR